MHTRDRELSEFFAGLQDRAEQRDAVPLVAIAVPDLADILGFGSARYGWVQFDPRETVTHASSKQHPI